MAIDLRSFFGIVALGSAAALGFACSDDGTNGTGAGGSQSTATTNPTNAGGAGGSTGAFTDGQIVGLEIDPPSATISVDNGVVPVATDFKVLAVYSDGTKGEIAAQWTFNRPDIALVAGQGDVTATGF